MFKLYYKKHNNDALFKAFEENNLRDIQNYIPLYGKFFNLKNSNYQSINLNQPFNITNLTKTDKKNTYICTVKSDKVTLKTKTFFKFSPLIDPIKYMVGKYGDIPNATKVSLPKLRDNTCHPKVLDPNNAAYVDGFFTYLTSNVLHKHRFAHGVDFFGSFLGIQKDFNVNILDDIEYLNDSIFFHKNRDTLFKVDIMDDDILFDAGTRNYRKKLKIDKRVSNTSTRSINNDDFNDVFSNVEIVGISGCNLAEALVFQSNSKKATSARTQDTSSRCSSRSSHTSASLSDNDSVAGSKSSRGDVSDTPSLSSVGSDMMCRAVISDFPVQIICLECMENTLDSLLNKDMKNGEWASCLFQIIMTLAAYQKMFSFTHNDLHTNNVMFNYTDRKFLIYKYNKTYYKVPTYGKVFKIIDFGRAIYKFNGNIICSDSFHSKGDAATQYNCGPYMNESKPRLEPNMSFDLCRLACSLYDHFVDTLGDDFEDDPVAKIIDEWCTDDKGRNILYKKCGEERYPDFKLYKMIARTVHKHTPQAQISHDLFRKYTSSRKKIGKRRVINIDDLPVYI